jgi:hypothetical protein
MRSRASNEDNPFKDTVSRKAKSFRGVLQLGSGKRRTRVGPFVVGFRRTARFGDVDIIYVKPLNYLDCRRSSLAGECSSGGY